MSIYQAGDFPTIYLPLVPEVDDAQLIQSSLGTTYADGFTDKRFDFSNGIVVSELRHDLIIEGRNVNRVVSRK
jgi:hypothetical protein